MSSEKSLERLVEGFESLTLEKAEWTHEAHMSVALAYVLRLGPFAAAPRMRSGIRRFNAHHGGAPSLYHETVTLAWVRLIADFARRSAETDPDRLCAAMIAELGVRDRLLRHYSKELLFAECARARWVEPDREPLP